MAKIVTYVSSNTYDKLLNIMYPDDHAKYRTLQEVERLITQGHTVEYRFGSNQSTVLDMDKFNQFIRPKFTYIDDPAERVSVQDATLRSELDNMVPVPPETYNANKPLDIPGIKLTPVEPSTTPSIEEEMVKEREKTNDIIVEENKESKSEPEKTEESNNTTNSKKKKK